MAHVVTPLLLASGGWSCKNVGTPRNRMASDPVQALCPRVDVHTCGSQTQVTGWVLAADYRLLDCILIVSPLGEEGE